VSLMTLFAGSATSGFSPLSLPNLALWLDASDTSTITLDGSNNVSEWRDKSGNARHASQATTTQRPSYTSSNQINGVNAPRFDGTDDFLATSNVTLGVMTIFAVVTARWTVAENAAFFGQNWTTNKSVGRVGAPGYDYVSNDLRAVTNSFNSGIAGPRAIGPQPGGLVNGASMLVAARLGTADTTIRANGTNVSRVARNDPTTAITLPLAIGRPGSAYAAEYWNGMIAELVLFDRVVSDSELTAVETYLKAKWGTP